MELEDTMLSETSQKQKDKYCMIITYMWNMKKIQQTSECSIKEADSQI